MLNKIELPTRFDPKEAESKWYDIWQEKGYFHAESESEKPSFCIVIPPPNVTGKLHVGHALNNSLQDFLIRWKRMEGYNVLWMPGTDHAGIATQNVVEKELLRDGLTRHDVGREKLVEKIWEWKALYGNTIIEQLKKLGCSCDWDRERFTMDEGLSSAVREVFVRLYNEGLIYRGNYLVNWCPRCHTALADDEVEYEDRDGKFYYIKYLYPDKSGGIEIATTRPETMLGDTALAVHPKDERFQDVIGKTVILPLMNREIPVIADNYVDPKFGTGALKITPAHDINDFLIGKKHNLPEINIMTPDAKINENGGKYQGLDRYKAREAVVEDLEKEGNLTKVEDLKNRVGICYRCETDVEPYLSRQWFVKMEPLMEEPIKAVKDGRVKFIPANWANTYFDWVENVRDWCISRQIWWGHRIPVWYCEDCDGLTVSMDDPTECSKCGSKSIRQDEDVLDTWFSSALWPFSTMGWPEETPLLKTFYPTSVLITAHDIIYFWVARMIMMGLKFMGDIPFDDVYITALVRDKYGRKMSKSLGNAIDPLDLTEEYGIDAVRFTLGIMAAQGRNINLDEKRIEGYRNFGNKIWNASRLVLSSTGAVSIKPIEDETPDLSHWHDRWIVSRLAGAMESVRKGIEEYKFNDACSALYEFIWHEYCDWYLELIKSRIYNEDDESHNAAVICSQVVLEATLRLLHSFMPFITEEIWQHLDVEGREDTSIMIQSLPKSGSIPRDEKLEAEIKGLFRRVGEIRGMRSELELGPNKELSTIFYTDDDKYKEILKKYYPHIKSFFKIIDNEPVIETMEIYHKTPHPLVVQFDPIPEIGISDRMFMQVLLPEADKDKLVERLNREISKLEGIVMKREKKLQSEGFRNKAPKEIVEAEESKLQVESQELQKKKSLLESFK